MKHEERGTSADRSESSLSEFYRAAFDGLIVEGVPTFIEVANLEASLSRIWDCGGSIASVLVAPTGEPVTSTVRDPAGNVVMVVADGYPRCISATSARYEPRWAEGGACSSSSTS